MGPFAVNRKDMNIGTGDGAGRWLFEEFMLSDSVFGRAVVAYDIEPQIEMDGRRVVSCHLDITNPVVVERAVFDDVGDEVALSEVARNELDAMVLGAFSAQLDRVREHENEMAADRHINSMADRDEAMERRLREV